MTPEEVSAQLAKVATAGDGWVLYDRTRVAWVGGGFRFEGNALVAEVPRLAVKCDDDHWRTVP